MLKSKNPNIEMLAIAVERLGKLIDDVVFPGGCATGLLLTDPAAPPIRATRDVDVMVKRFRSLDVRNRFAAALALFDPIP